MKLHKSQRSALAEAICKIWIRRRGIKMPAPWVYVIRRRDYRWTGHVAGNSHNGARYITLHFGPGASHKDQMILLAHEFAHQLDYWTSSRRWRNENQPHGERFQRLFWRTLNRRHWARASQDRWILGRSAHRPEFQPDPEPIEQAA